MAFSATTYGQGEIMPYIPVMAEFSQDDIDVTAYYRIAFDNLVLVKETLGTDNSGLTIPSFKFTFHSKKFRDDIKDLLTGTNKTAISNGYRDAAEYIYMPVEGMLRFAKKGDILPNGIAAPSNMLIITPNPSVYIKYLVYQPADIPVWAEIYILDIDTSTQKSGSLVLDSLLLESLRQYHPTEDQFTQAFTLVGDPSYPGDASKDEIMEAKLAKYLEAIKCGGPNFIPMKVDAAKKISLWKVKGLDTTGEDKDYVEGSVAFTFYHEYPGKNVFDDPGDDLPGSGRSASNEAIERFLRFRRRMPTNSSLLKGGLGAHPMISRLIARVKTEDDASYTSYAEAYQAAAWLDFVDIYLGDGGKYYPYPEYLSTEAFPATLFLQGLPQDTTSLPQQLQSVLDSIEIAHTNAVTAHMEEKNRYASSLDRFDLPHLENYVTPHGTSFIPIFNPYGATIHCKLVIVSSLTNPVSIEFAGVSSNTELTINGHDFLLVRCHTHDTTNITSASLEFRLGDSSGPLWETITIKPLPFKYSSVRFVVVTATYSPGGGAPDQTLSGPDYTDASMEALNAVIGRRANILFYKPVDTVTTDIGTVTGDIIYASPEGNADSLEWSAEIQALSNLADAAADTIYFFVWSCEISKIRKAVGIAFDTPDAGVSDFVLIENAGSSDYIESTIAHEMGHVLSFKMSTENHNLHFNHDGEQAKSGSAYTTNNFMIGFELGEAFTDLQNTQIQITPIQAQLMNDVVSL